MTDDGSWSADPEPGDRLHGRPPPVLHDVAANRRPRPAQTRLAVHWDTRENIIIISS